MKEIVKKLEGDRLLLEISRKVYDTKAITQTAYKFTNKCYIHIDPISEEAIGAYFKSKPESRVSLEEIANDFCNELIDQQVRIDTERTYGNIRDAIVRQAFSPIEPAGK